MRETAAGARDYIPALLLHIISSRGVILQVGACTPQQVGLLD